MYIFFTEIPSYNNILELYPAIQVLAHICNIMLPLPLLIAKYQVYIPIALLCVVSTHDIHAYNDFGSHNFVLYTAENSNDC